MRDYFYRLMTDRQGGVPAALLKGILGILSCVYGLVVTTRNFLYALGILRALDLGRCVISVGNITWGGVGKTPFVIFLAEHLSARGKKPAILTRGYMKKNLGASDEAVMMRQYVPDVPVGVGPNRWQTSREILKSYNVDVFILDDGFQHRKIRRDLDIVLIDATNPFGNGALIPRGILREPLRALKRAQIIVLTKSDINPSFVQDLEDQVRQINTTCVIGWAVHAPQALGELFLGRQEPLANLRGKKVVSFCSIGDPQSFQASLQKIGAVVEKNFVFCDHYLYCANDIQTLVEKAKNLGVEDFVTTAKDAVKILQFKGLFGACRCWILKIEIDLIKGKEQVFERIDHLLGR